MVRRDREQPPRAAAQRVDDDQREHREQDDHDRENRDHRRQAGHRVHFLFRHLAERLAVAPDRRDEDREVLHGAAQDDAQDEPERPRQKPELGRQRRPDQRARAGDRREMMAVGDPAVGRMEVAPVVEPLGGRRPLGIEREDLRRDESPVEPVRDQVRADAGDENPGRADRLARATARSRRNPPRRARPPRSTRGLRAVDPWCRYFTPDEDGRSSADLQVRRATAGLKACTTSHLLGRRRSDTAPACRPA